MRAARSPGRVDVELGGGPRKTQKATKVCATF